MNFSGSSSRAGRSMNCSSALQIALSSLSLFNVGKTASSRVVLFTGDPFNSRKNPSLRTHVEIRDKLWANTRSASSRRIYKAGMAVAVFKLEENFVVEDPERGDVKELEPKGTNGKENKKKKKRKKENAPNDKLHNLAKLVAVRVASEDLGSDEDIMGVVHETGLRVDVRSMNVVVWQLGQMRNWDAASRVFRAFRSASVEPNAHVCTTLIAVLGYGRRLPEALKLFRWMEKQGIERPIYTFNALMVACGRGILLWSFLRR